jgi:hypothetical protein
MGGTESAMNTFGRVAKYSSHHKWISRDYEDVDCKAVACMFNVGEKCAVPSRANFGTDARCTGFQLPPPKKIEGD